MEPFFPKSIGHLESIVRIKKVGADHSNGVIHKPQYIYRPIDGQHLYVEEDVQMLWNQLQAARETINLQNKAIESLLTVKKLFEGKA